MSIIYELPTEISSLSQPSAEWVELLKSNSLPGDSLDDIITLRGERLQFVKSYLESEPAYLGETNVVVTDKTYTGGSPDSTLPIRIYTPCDDDNSGKTYPVLLWFHGGGFVFGCNLADDELLRYICHHSKIIVVTAGYRLAPEHKFPAAPEDAWAAAKWVRDNADVLRASPTDKGYYVGGISAGGNLACVVARRARDYDENIKIDGQLLGYPWTCSIRDHQGFPETLTNFSGIKENEKAPLLSVEKLGKLEVLYGSPDTKNPDFSPLHDPKELKGLPRAVIFVAGADSLRDDGIAYWRALGRDGSNPRLRIFPGMPHSFHRFKQMKASREFKIHLEEGMKELIGLRDQHSIL